MKSIVSIFKYLIISILTVCTSTIIVGQNIEFYAPASQSSEAQSIVYLDNAYYIGGYVEPESWLYSLPYLIKVNMKGDTIWTQMIRSDEQNEDKIVGMAALNDHLVVLASRNRQMFITLMDQNGEEKWSYSHPMVENPVSIITTVNNEIIACGSCVSDDFNEGRPAICILKLDRNGKILWSQITGKGDRIKPYALASSQTGNIVLTGRRRLSGSSETFVMILDNQGNDKDILSLKDFDVDYAFAVKTDGKGNIFLAGEAQSRSNPVLVKLDKEGKFQWNQIYDGTSGNFRAYDLSIMANGNFIIAGRTNDAKGFILSADASGKLKEIKTFSGKEKAGFKSITLSQGESFACAGLSLQGGNQTKMYALIVKDQ